MTSHVGAPVFSPEEKKEMLARLARIEGQVRGVRDMVTREEECERIAQQLAAVRGALKKAFSQMMACAIQQRLADEGVDPRQPQLKHLTQILSKYG
jgi:DNA-binding FrmR family transcriptional regulator